MVYSLLCQKAKYLLQLVWIFVLYDGGLVVLFVLHIVGLSCCDPLWSSARMNIQIAESSISSFLDILGINYTLHRHTIILNRLNSTLPETSLFRKLISFYWETQHLRFVHWGLSTHCYSLCWEWQEASPPKLLLNCYLGDVVQLYNYFQIHIFSRWLLLLVEKLRIGWYLKFCSLRHY